MLEGSVLRRVAHETQIHIQTPSHAAPRACHSLLHSHCPLEEGNSAQSLSHVPLFAIPWTAARQASLSITNSPSLLKLMSIELVMELWCHPAISSSVVPFLSCLQSFPASGSFQMSQLFTSDGQSIGASASASFLPVNIQNWFPLCWIDLISLQSKGLSRVFSNTTIQKHQFFGAQLSL